ncbi:MAG: endonuclease III domain-containing protein [Thalassobaculum sp.]
MLSEEDVETVFRRLAERAPPGPRDPHVKEDPEPFKALVSCLLSAQSRDENTARARDALFALADTPAGILALDDAAIAAAIKPCGLYNTKTRNLRRLCTHLLEVAGGVVPRTREGLMALPGIGRKCADIMLLFTYGQPAIAVDTHVHRVCNRLGLARGKTEADTARSLDGRAPDWAKLDGHLWLLEFGKLTCRSRAPLCESCFLRDLCAWPARRA